MVQGFGFATQRVVCLVWVCLGFVGEVRAAEKIVPRKTSAAEIAAALDRVAANPDIQRPDSATARAASRLLYQLHGLPAAERYAVLAAWTLPNKDRTDVRHLMQLLPDPPPPNAFLADPLPPVSDPVLSSLSLLVDAARDNGRLDALEAVVQPLIGGESDSATRLWQLIQQVKTTGKPANLGALLSLNQIEELLKQSKGSADFRMILWLYRTRAHTLIADTEGADLQPDARPGLKHWVPVDLAGAANYNTFGSTSWWIAAEDRIGHICSPWVDHLAFAYPLTGTFQISCEAYNDFWSEGNVGFGGLIFEPWNQGSQANATYPANAHEVVPGPPPTERRGAFNPLTIDVQPNRLRVLGIDETLFEDASPSQASPFFFLRTTWLCAFRKFRITGEPVIPREVALLAGDRMDGWMTSFYNESQPPELSIRQPNAPVKRDRDPQAFDWSAVEGVLHARKFSDINAAGRQSGFRHGESWAYYHRPLRDNERLRYEFFYQPGDARIEVHPTLDRLVFLLVPDGVKLHWLTCNRGLNEDEGWLPTQNVIVESQHRRGPKPLPFKPNDWNTAALELRDGQVRVELNGELIYERPFEPAWGTRFGFYHDRTASASQIRNVILSGDWPRWTPELANNLLERTAPLTHSNRKAIQAILSPHLTKE